MFEGSWVALITPMTAQGQIDYTGLQRLVDFHLENGTAGLVLMGTTGEAATISLDEQLDVLRAVIAQVKGRMALVAGNGANDTAEAVRKTKLMSTLAIDGFLTVTPYYNKPTQEGMRSTWRLSRSRDGSAVRSRTKRIVLLRRTQRFFHRCHCCF